MGIFIVVLKAAFFRFFRSGLNEDSISFLVNIRGVFVGLGVVLSVIRLLIYLIFLRRRGEIEV